MPFDGSGNFTRSYNFVQDKTNGIKIVASRMDGEFDNFANAMNQAFLRNGLVPLTGSLNMGTNTINSLGDGTVGTPAIRFNSDPATGIYVPGYGKVAFTAGGIKRLEANSAGVDITGGLGVSSGLAVTGAATVGGTLNVASSITGGNINGVNGTFTGNIGAAAGTFSGAISTTQLTATVTNNAGIVLGNNSAIRDVSNGGSTMSFDVSSGGATHGAFQWRSSNAFTTRMYLDSSGRLGVNVVPAGSIDVMGANARSRLDLSTTDATWITTNPAAAAYQNVRHDALAHRWSLSNSDIMYLDSSGRLGIGTTPIAGYRLTASGSMALITAAGATLNIDPDTSSGANGVNIASSFAAGGYGPIRFTTSATERMRIAAGGNVGVNTNNPGSLLDVAGSSATDIFHVTSGTTYFAVGVTNGSNVALNGFQTAVGVKDMILQSAGGNVGVGITPTQKLQVNGNALATTYFTPAGNGVWFSGGGSFSTGVASDGAGTTLNMYTSGSIRFGINPSGGITSSNLADAVGYKGLPQNQQTGAYTLALSDMGKHMYITAGTFAVTIPNNATVAFPVGTAITIINEDAVKTVSPGAGVTLARAGDGATGTRTLAVGAVATLVKVQTDRWYISGAGIS